MAWVALGLAAAQAQQAPVLTLQQAVNMALEKNPLRKAAAADVQVAGADVRVARSFVLPKVTLTETATLGDDPVYVFGSKLRQQRFTANDFTLNRLNTPDAYGNFETRLGGTWTLFDSFASWHGMARARQRKEAAGRQLERTDQEVVFRVVSAYLDAQLAAKQLAVASQAQATAQAIVERSQARFDSGVAVQSDLLAAKVRLASRQQELIRARDNVELAESQLALAMGVPLSERFALSDALGERNLELPALAELEQQALTQRPDLKRVAAETAAQHESVAMAKASFGPRVNAFAGWQTDHPSLLAGGGGSNWLGGVSLQLDLFAGGAKRAELARERALEERAAALRHSADDQVRMEVRRAYYEVDASRQQVEVARAVIAEAQESLRILQDRYENGLTTMTDVLGAEDATRHSQTDYWEALSRLQTSYAHLELARGTLTPQSPVVMP